LVVASVPAFARQKLGHEVPKAVCSTVADKGDSGMFEWRNGKRCAGLLRRRERHLRLSYLERSGVSTQERL
jgi:hypothetical protein